MPFFRLSEFLLRKNSKEWLQPASCRPYRIWQVEFGARPQTPKNQKAQPFGSASMPGPKAVAKTSYSQEHCVRIGQN
jgi:hypothetical protein